ncbi:MAG TPA: FGGY family carbohydrate kinase [Gammaproteobacteria bacterium]|nr:FGGY family carbohydrate kinase [Gammaproteobacteria bacterium]
MGQGRWLCIDQGGQSSRAAVFDDEGRLVTLGRASVETRRAGPDRVEHSPKAMADSVAAAIAQALERLPDRGRSLSAAGLATQRSTLVCIDRKSGAALSPIMSWQDRRGAAELEAAAGGSAARIREVTGLRLSPHYGVGKLRWCLAHIDDVAAAAAERRLVAAPLAAFLLQRLGVGNGAWQVDHVNASRMLLMDVQALDWSQELLELFGVDAGMLPLLVPCRFAYGNLRAGDVEVPLAVCTGDQPAALFGAGPPRPGTVLVNIGTGAFIQCATGDVPLSVPDLLTSVGGTDGTSRLYVLEGTVNGAASAVAAALEELGLAAPSGPALDAAFADIERAPLFLNGVSGLGSPDWAPDFESRYVGEGAPLARLAAVYESIVFLIVRNLDVMRRTVPLERIVLTGGLARVDFVARRLAALSGVAVRRPESGEATLHGLAAWLRGGVPAEEPASATAFEAEADGVARSRYAAWTAALEAALGDRVDSGSSGRRERSEP